MSEKRLAIVTGGTRGIGNAIAKKLYNKFQGKVCLTGTNADVCEKVVSEMKKEGYNVIGHQLDISDESSIATLTEFVSKNYGGLDILINNAGMAYKMTATEPFSEQAENTVAVNFFGTLNLCKSLFPLLRPHARVVNVSSSLGMLDRIPGQSLKEAFLNENLTEDSLCAMMKDFVDSTKNGTHLDKGWSGSAYNVSKVGLSALTFVQQKQFDQDDREDIVVNAVHPGFVETDMSSHRGPLKPDQGAEAPLYLALLPRNTEIKGKMVWTDKKVVDWAGTMPAEIS